MSGHVLSKRARARRAMQTASARKLRARRLIRWRGVVAAQARVQRQLDALVLLVLAQLDAGEVWARERVQRVNARVPISQRDLAHNALENHMVRVALKKLADVQEHAAAFEVNRRLQAGE